MPSRPASPGEAINRHPVRGQLRSAIYDCTMPNLVRRRAAGESDKSLADLKDKKLGVQSMGSAARRSEGLCEGGWTHPAKEFRSCRSVLAPRRHLGSPEAGRRVISGRCTGEAGLFSLKCGRCRRRSGCEPADVGPAGPDGYDRKKFRDAVGIARAVAKGYDFAWPSRGGRSDDLEVVSESRSKNPDLAQAIAEGLVVNQAASRSEQRQDRPQTWSLRRGGLAESVAVSKDQGLCRIGRP